MILFDKIMIRLVSKDDREEAYSTDLAHLLSPAKESTSESMLHSKQPAKPVAIANKKGLLDYEHFNSALV